MSEPKSECCGAEYTWDIVKFEKSGKKLIPVCSKCHKPCQVKEERGKMKEVHECDRCAGKFKNDELIKTYWGEVLCEECITRDWLET